MWSWIPAAVSAVLAILKGLFGLDTPQRKTTHETPSPLPPPAPADVLRDLGIAPDATGTTGGAFPTAPVADRLHHRSDGGGASHSDSSGATAAGDGERDSQR